MKLHHRLHAHFSQHHKKYVGWLFAGFAVIKAILLFAGFFGLTNFASTFASNDNLLTEQYFGLWSEYTANRTDNTCDPANMTVEYINNFATSGADTIPSTLNENTIYVLLSWLHITSWTIYLTGCSAIIGSGDVTLYSSIKVSKMLYTENTENAIIDNVKIDGEGDGLGSTHEYNTVWIYLMSSSNNTISNSEIYNNKYVEPATKCWIYLESSSNNTISNTKVHDNDHGIYFESSSNNNTISNSQTYTNDIAGIFISASSGNTINKINTYNNSQGIVLGYSSNNIISNNEIYFNDSGIGLDNSSSNSINNTQIYNNRNGIYLSASSGNTINYSQTYNNEIGINLNGSSNNTINNIQVYNNTEPVAGKCGIYLSSSPNNTINNAQVYNNDDGVQLLSSANVTINNSAIYNNSNYGISTDSQSGLLNDVSIYNNEFGIIKNDLSVSYYGKLTMFANGSNSYESELITWSAEDFPGIFTGWTLSEDEFTMSCDYITNPANGDGLLLINAQEYPDCNSMGENESRTPDENVYYTYGTWLYRQIQPVMNTGTEDFAFSLADLSWDPSRYIAQWDSLIFSLTTSTTTLEREIQVTINIWEQANYELYGDFEGSPIEDALSGTDQLSLTLTEGFGNKIISLRVSNNDISRTKSKTITYMEDGYPYQYYGTTTYTSGWTENTCDPANMTVEEISAWTDQIPEYLSGNTIYVLLSWSHITSRQIVLATCSAIVGSGDVTIYPNTYLGPVLYGENVENTIIDNVKIDGTGDGIGLGILLSYSTNNTINNSQMYNNTEWIKLSHSDNNIISNSQMYNNINRAENWPKCWIDLEYSNNNIINNSQLYNNDHGIYLKNSSNNIINNTQTYNNRVGIYLKASSNNVINNTQVYNNSDDGIIIENLSDNDTISNSAIYNNLNNGINISIDNGVFNNLSIYNNWQYGIANFWDITYYGTLIVFENEDGNINDYPLAAFTTWSAETFPGIFTDWIFSGAQAIMSCNYVTNPINASGISLIDTTEYPDCNFTGKNDSRIPDGNISYTYGTWLDKQIQPVMDTWTENFSFSLSDLSWNQTKYIAEISPISILCGDWIRNGAETCDDGNTSGGDGCSSNCTTETTPISTAWSNGGWVILTKDICSENRDCSSSYYDKLCGPCPTTGHQSADSKTGDITNSPYSTELTNAYQRAYANGLTAMPTIQRANIDGKIIRSHFAKMITEFAIKVLGKKPNTKITCTFADITHESVEMKFYIKTACQLGLMGRESDGKTTQKIFNPKDTITRAQFGTVVSRLLYSATYNTTDKVNRYGRHLQALKKAEIINNISKPDMEEVRGYVMLILQRASK